VEDLRPRIPSAAYHGCRGWTIAKGVVRNDRWKALRLYLTAVLRGCYRPRLAVIIFLQIFLSDGQYRRIADWAIGWLGVRTRRARSSKALASVSGVSC
jgi:hypothetical protein